MSADLIQKLAADIKEKDHRELVEKENRLQVAKLIKEQAPALWHDLAETLRTDIDGLKAGFENTTLSGDLTFGQEDGGKKITISKRDLPYVQCWLNLNIDGQCVDGSYKKANPHQNTQKPEKNVKWNIPIKVDQANRAYFEIDGQRQHIDGVADTIMKTLFSV